MPGDRQAEPGAFHGAVALRIHLAEILKYFSKILFLNATAGVLHLDVQQLRVRLLSRSAAHREFHIALPGEFQAVVQKIDQNLSDPSLIAVIPARYGHIELAFEQDPPL